MQTDTSIEHCINVLTCTTGIVEKKILPLPHTVLLHILLNAIYPYAFFDIK